MADQNGLPPGFNPLAAMQILKMMQTQVPPIASETISVADCLADLKKREADTLFWGFNAQIKAARHKLSQAIPYSISSYPLDFLDSEVIKALRAAVNSGQAEIVINNRCCNREDCPQMQYQRLLIQEIREACS